MVERAESISPVQSSAARELWPVGLATALSLMGDATLYAVLPLHPADAGIALASVGIILSVNRIIRLATNGPAGWLFDRLPDRRTLFLGSLWLGVISTAIYALAPGLEVLFFGRLLWGLAWSGIWVGGNAIVLQMAPPPQRGRWVGLYQFWFFFGSTLGSFLGGVLTDAVGYRVGLWIGAGISAVGALAAVAGMAGQSTVRVHLPHIPHSVDRGIANWRAVPPALWGVAAAHGLNRMVVSGIVSATLGLVIQSNLGSQWQWGEWQIGIASITGGLLAGRTLISLAGAPLAGVWSDAAGRRWELLAASLVAGGAGIGLLALPGALPVIAGTFLGAAASGSIQALATTLAGDLSGARRHGSNLGLLYTSGDLGSAIGPLAAYAFLSLGGLPVIYSASAVLMWIVAVWVMLLARGR